MHHCDEDALAAAALGEELSADAAQHLASCAECAGQVSELSSIAQLASVGATEITAPPPQVWHNIQSQLAQAPGQTPSRSRPWWGLVAGAAAAFALGAVAINAWESAPEEQQVVAAAPLAALPEGPGGDQSGQAQVRQTAEGMVLTIAASGLANPSGYYEAWLLDPATGGVIALGVVPVDASAVTLPLPDGADLSVYSAVDVSDEPFDGNPGHSSVSVLRGVFTT